MELKQLIAIEGVPASLVSFFTYSSHRINDTIIIGSIFKSSPSSQEFKKPINPNKSSSSYSITPFITSSTISFLSSHSSQSNYQRDGFIEGIDGKLFYGSHTSYSRQSMKLSVNNNNQHNYNLLLPKGQSFLEIRLGMILETICQNISFAISKLGNEFIQSLLLVLTK